MLGLAGLVLLCLPVSHAQFARSQFCPLPVDLWKMRAPQYSGVSRCGTGEIIGGPTSTTFTMVTVTNTIPGPTAEPSWSLTKQDTCCPKTVRTTSLLPRYTTPPPYEYDWVTTTISYTSTTVTIVSKTTTSMTNPPRVTLTFTTTNTILPNNTDNVTDDNTTTPYLAITNTSTTSSSSTTTETSTTTSSSTSRTTTFTSRTTTKTTVTKTVSRTTETTSSLVTQTSTTTTSSTFTTLPPDRTACAPLCPRLTPKACRGTLEPERTCETQMLDSVCFAQTDLLFYCPGTNRNPKRPQDLLQGSYSVKCWICSFELEEMPDVDQREGYLLVDLKFGPNMLENNIDESPLSGYAVFLTDVEGNRLGEPVEVIDKSSKPQQECCEVAAYSARIATTLPPGVREVRLEVAPVLIGLGPLAVGRLTLPIADNWPFRKIPTAQASLKTSVTWSCSLLTAVASAGLLWDCR
ncbi:unnamed protein product [Polarella glacialis]|uniref:Uncharacterized protein n=2 Tax=Polarella glacialis TaxID=89957 RepID=A0A813HAK6_POLGL|nr:unnamed protein product [Polarella glacialis]